MADVLSFGSLFAGIGGFDLGFERSGMRCAWQVEIDARCRSVLRRHFPSCDQFSDVRECGKSNLAPVDVVCGGFPCQDLSVAGSRGGLSGSRSGLFWHLVRIVDELRPRYVVWENVAGLGTSDDRWDFARVLRGLADVGYFGAVRLVDARWIGVPQRRRRYFGVFARVGSGAEWRSACEILAVADSLRRHPAESGKAGQDVAGTLGGGSYGRGWCDDTDRATFIPVEARFLTGKKGSRYDGGTDTLIPAFASTIQASAGHHGHSSPRGDGTDNLIPAIAATLRSRQASPGVSAPGRGGEDDANLVAFQCHGGSVGPMGTLRKGNGSMTGGVPSIETYTGVRRLTPRECERCQGFPDDWTRWDAEGVEVKDSRRYAMIGNSVVPAKAEWIGRRLVTTADREDRT